MAKRIGFIGYDNITALDLIALLEAFGTANTFVEGRPHAYELIVMSASGKPFRSELGVSICASIAFKDAPPLDTILVPGGAGLRDPNISEPVVSFLKARALDASRGIGLYWTGSTRPSRPDEWAPRHNPLALCCKHRKKVSTGLD